MRLLKEEEMELVFAKLAKYIGENIRKLIEREDGKYVFRIHENNVYYVREDIAKRAGNFERSKLRSFGVCLGKFTKKGNFFIKITALDILAQYALYKVWVKPSNEMSFLYGNDVFKAGLGRITDATPRFQECVVYTMDDIPIGFGRTAKTTYECRKADPNAVVVFHQEDLGMYLREEQNLI